MARILCVDDEPSIREMLSAILKQHGYEVVCVASVSEAVAAVATQTFDVLLADLNVGHPADGFTVVSAMRRTQPHCLTFILTGYPALESALQALREQVDDYIIKPLGIPDIIRTIEAKLGGEKPRTVAPVKRLSILLLEHKDEIVWRTLAAIHSKPELNALPLSDEEQLANLGEILNDLANQLESKRPDDINRTMLQSASLRGKMRRAQGYPIPLMIESARLLDEVLNTVIYENLLSIDLSYLLLDLHRLHDNLLAQLQEAIKAYLEPELVPHVGRSS